MSYSVPGWLAFALLLFWAMGAYKRLVRLRLQGRASFAVLEGLFSQYVLLVKTNFPEINAGPSVPASSNVQARFYAAWTDLAVTAEQFNAALKVAHALPPNGPTIQALRAAQDAMHLSWSRLQDLPIGLAGPALPGALQSQWDHVALQVETARTEFNQWVVNYNEAINQFPALLLAYVFGFKSAQPI